MSNNFSDSLVTVNKSKNEIVYSINDPELLYKNGLKSVQHNAKRGFVDCSGNKVNGVQKIKYDISSYNILPEVMKNITEENYLKIVQSLISTVLFLKEEITIQMENIRLTPDMIFIDDNYKAFLVYVPINIKVSPNAHIVFEKNIREMLVLQFTSNKANKQLVSEFSIEICKALGDRSVSLREISNRIESHELATREVSGSTSAFGGGTKTFRPKLPDFSQELTNEEPENKEEKQPSGADIINRKTKDKSYDTGKKDSKKEKTAPKKEKDNSNTIKVVGFFAGYFIIAAGVSFIALNYYKNSGMTLGFIVTLVILMLFLVLSPVIYLMKKNGTGNKKMPDAELMFDDREVPGGFIPSIVLEASAGAENTKFFINKEKYVIGKSKELVDGFIPFDKTISDTHCEVFWNQKQFFIKDLDSEYGTYVNEVRVIPGQAFPLRSGDRIKLNKHVYTVKQI